MKHRTWIAVGALTVFSVYVHAGEQNTVPAGSDNAALVARTGSVSLQPDAPMKSNMGRIGKTRAEVIQELIQAQKDGSLARLNGLYNGS
jgi:hypothetical protein